MNKKIIIACSCILLVIVIGSIIFISENDKKGDTNNLNNYLTTIYDRDGNIVYNGTRDKEVTEVVENTIIQGMVELNHNGYIYIFNGQHFGEFGLEMQEYTRANIINKKQKCIDYLTSKEYDTTYIKEGDILICKGDLSKKGYSMGDADFDTKDNPIIVLKAKDYYEMKKQSINNEIQTVISVADYYTDHIYLKYNIVNNNNNLPFALKFNITSTTQVIGNIAKGKEVKIQYEDLNVPIDELELKSIEVIEK
ncbi:MAG: hypothetical protein ACLTKT_01965 [Clostridia bacterium]